MTAIVDVVKVNEPGVYDLPVEAYHADPVEGGSLSSTGARRLLPPSCPAIFDYFRRHPEPPKRIFDFGHAAHFEVLGDGPIIVPVDAPDWRTKAAREERDEIRASGAVPLLAHEHEQVKAMAAVIRDHPIASRLLQAGSGKAEQTLVWQDQLSGVWRRALLDWFPNRTASGRLIVPDYKSAQSADPEAFARSAANYGYHVQAAWYLDGITALDQGDDPAFVFVVQEKDPPHLVTVVELDAVALRIGRSLARRAIDVFVECNRTGVWPGYSDEVELVSLPAYYESRHAEEAL